MQKQPQNSILGLSDSEDLSSILGIPVKTYDPDTFKKHPGDAILSSEDEGHIIQAIQRGNHIYILPAVEK